MATTGKSAAGAFRSVSSQNGRRLAMMGLDGDLPRIGRTPELLDAVAKYGDPAMEFVWKHKGALQAAAALTAFLDSPEPYLDGTVNITNAAAEKTAKPETEQSAPVGLQSMKELHWGLVAAGAACAVGVGVAVGRAARQSGTG